MAMKLGAVLVVVLVLLVAVDAVYGADIIVGGNSGWDQGVNYDTWAASQTFRVGDNLVFNYDGNHKVDEVKEDEYKACSSSNPISSNSGGSTSIPLSDAGPRYFICPTPGHCGTGMKLKITVLATNNTTPGAAPSPPSASPPPPPSTSSPSPPSPTGAATANFLDSKANLMFGALAVYLATLLVYF